MSIAALRSNELVRKAIHLSSAAIPLLYLSLFEKDVMLKGVIFLAFGFLLAEYLRLHYSWAKQAFMMVFGSAIRDHEKDALTGATYVFTGAVLCIFLFPKEIAVPSLLILSISDTFAALIGIPFGKHKFLAKSLEGSLSFLLSTIAILYWFSPDTMFINMLIAILLTVAEAYPQNLDDNFVIPLLSGILLTLSSLI